MTTTGESTLKPNRSRLGFFSFSRLRRILPLLLADIACVAVAVWAAFAIRMGDWWPLLLQNALLLIPLAILITVPIFFIFGVYRSVVLYAGHKLVYSLAKSVSLSLLLVIASWVLLKGAMVPRSAWLIYWFVLLGLTGGFRILLRDYLRWSFAGGPAAGNRVLVYGAGIAGVQLATALQQDPDQMPVAFIDDDTNQHGSEILGLKVYPPGRVRELVQRHNVNTLLLAVPSASRKRRREILDWLAPLPVQVLIMPSLTELASGSKQVSDLREVDIEDLLGRDPIDPHPALMSACLRSKVVLVTGAGGSIGSELCRQIISQNPKRLILFEISEYGLYSIERELRARIKEKALVCDLIPVLGSVNHRRRVAEVVKTFRVQTVYHAAAYKHVPIVEHNPIEGVQNNIFGTYYVALAAMESKVETFVLVSTDKAVRPTNVMGATKRFAELVLQCLAQQANCSTCFSIVRFGNVLASSGSVVPLFREQIYNGGPVTVTDREMVRYFMTIPEAAQLVIQAGALAKGGEVFLLDMGEPVRIDHLARRMIELSGFDVRDANNPDGDIEIQYIGVRPGEKLYEELLVSGQEVETEHPMINQEVESIADWDAVKFRLERLRIASKDFNYNEIRSVFLEGVQGYSPSGDIEDWLWIERRDTAA